MRVELTLDGAGTSVATTGMPFFDHMLQQLGTHGGFDLSVSCDGDLAVDGHHTVEDCGLAVGQALKEALGDKAGVRRFASIVVPLDEAAVEVALDLSGRTFVVHDVPVPAEMIGTFDTGLVEDFVRAFAQAAELTRPRPPAERPVAPPRRRGGVQGAREGPARRVLADRAGRGPEHEGNAVSARIAVLDYGMGNLHSVARALDRVGADVVVTARRGGGRGRGRPGDPGGRAVRGMRPGAAGRRARGRRASVHRRRPAGLRRLRRDAGPLRGQRRGCGAGARRAARPRATAPAGGQGPPHGMEHGRVDRTAPPVRGRDPRRHRLLLRALVRAGRRRSDRRRERTRPRLLGGRAPRAASSRPSSTRRSRARRGSSSTRTS